MGNLTEVVEGAHESMEVVSTLRFESVAPTKGYIEVIRWRQAVESLMYAYTCWSLRSNITYGELAEWSKAPAY